MAWNNNLKTFFNQKKIFNSFAALASSVVPATVGALGHFVLLFAQYY